MHKSGSGATTERCCFNGSDLLLLRPVCKKLGCCQRCSQQPLNEPSTLTAGHMVLRPLGHRLPACPDVRAAFNHSSFWLQRRGPPHSMQISVMQQKLPHTELVTEPERIVPCVYSRKQGGRRKKKKNQVDITTLLPSSQIHRYHFFASVSARLTEKTTTWFMFPKVKHYTESI